jgi:hypothetical protein
MPLIQQYDTPAGIDDFEDDPQTRIEFRAAWHKEVQGIVIPKQQSEPPPVGEPGLDAARGARSRAGVARGATSQLDPAPPEPEETAWIDPLTEDAEEITARSLSWIAFPRQVLPARRRDERERAFAEAEANRAGDQDEYFEWHTTRRPEDNKIVKVVFVTETPEYWRVLARTSPERLVQLYQELVSPEVQEADLFEEQLTEDGAIEKVYVAGNRWNTTDGIVHFIVSINNLTLAVSLARGGATGRRPLDAYADPDHNKPQSVDNYLPRDVNALVRNKGRRVAVQDPVGLYIDGWDDTGWTKPDGSPVGNYWRIVRGVPGRALRVEYEVPKDVEEREGFVVGDIRIGGRPITYGGQIAEHMTSSLPIVVYRGRS